ncbi:Epsilon-trimethyllysine 2-oxoglutarate dioxygenase [Gryllus bimaculatus]|nr:Epsilon-trimethyllysine 2-oxoglutarate dioxygenase [Gryllus bimaculatus]
MWFNMYDRAPLKTVAMENMQDFYEDFINLSKIICDPQNEWWFKLQPGTVLIFNNWRVLHGRAAYTGHRRIAGCYIGYSDWHSKARTLGLL